MAAILDTEQLKLTTLTPRAAANLRNRDAVAPETAAKLSRLEPASTEEADLPEPPILSLTLGDIELLRELAKAVADARDVLTAADAVLAAAQAQARGLVLLEHRAGAIAAEAFRGGADAKQAAKAVASDIADCKQTIAAVPVLMRERDMAANEFALARGRLHGATTDALKACMLRASRKYSELAIQVTEAVAAIDAGLKALPSRMSDGLITGWYVHCLHDLSLPAMPDSLRVGNGVVDMNFRPSLLRGDHPRLTAHMSLAKGRLDAQLREAVGPSGIDVDRLLA